MRKKNPILKYLNIRSLKYLIFKFCCKISFLKNLLNLHDQEISLDEIEDKEVIAQYFNKDECFFNLAKLKNMLIYSKTGNTIDQKTNKAFYVSRNYFKPFLTKETIIIDDCDVINLIGIHKGFKHFFHLFFDYYIILFNFLTNHYDKSKKLKILVRSNLNNIQLDLIRFLEKEFQNIQFIKVKNNQKIICKNLIFFNKKHFIFYNSDTHPKVSKIISSFRDFLVKNYEIKENYDKKFIYITRNDAALRRIKNEKEVLDFLNEFNFETHSLAKLDFKSQIEIFLNAKFIVGAHGAGFTNIIFCKNNTALLEIFPKNHYDLGYIMLSKVSGVKRYELIENNEFSKQDFSININRFKTKVKEIISTL